MSVGTRCLIFLSALGGVGGVGGIGSIGTLGLLGCSSRHLPANDNGSGGGRPIGALPASLNSPYGIVVLPTGELAIVDNVENALLVARLK